MALKKAKNHDGRKFSIRGQTCIQGDTAQVQAHMSTQCEQWDSVTPTSVGPAWYTIMPESSPSAARSSGCFRRSQQI